MSDNEQDHIENKAEAIKAKDEAASSEHLNIKVKDTTGATIYFKVKRTTKLGKLMDAYCSRVGKDIKSFRFLFDGERINQEHTPESLGMEDDDEIDAMVAQVGGAL